DQEFLISDAGLLDSALMRPRTSAFGEPAYPTLWAQAERRGHSAWSCAIQYRLRPPNCHASAAENVPCSPIARSKISLRSAVGDHWCSGSSAAAQTSGRDR